MKEAKRRGFTLVELSLSLAFIGILSVIIVVMINNTVQTYQRGVTLNKVNTTGMDIVDDMRVAIQNSSSDSVTALCVDYYNDGSAGRVKCIADNADSFVRITKRATVEIPDIGNSRVMETLTDVPVYGAFCTGSYSYIWNSGYFEDDAESNASLSGYGRRRIVGAQPAILKYSVFENGRNTVKTVSDFRLLKVRDDTRAVCVSAMRGVVERRNGANQWRTTYLSGAEVDTAQNYITNVFDISNVTGSTTAAIYPYMDMSEPPVEILDTGTYNDLVLYDLYVSAPAISSTDNNMFYAASFILGTVRGGINIKATGRNCTPPSEYETEDFDYCAINKFNFAVQASGEVTK